MLGSSCSSQSQSGGGPAPRPGNYDYSLQVGNLNRTYRVHVPAAYHADRPAPLVLVFHGGGGNADNMATYYNWIPESDQQGFIVAFPNGTSGPAGLSTWNAGNCCGYAQSNNVDDIGFVKAILADMKSKYNVDRSRVFGAGFSNGGMLTYRLACEMSDQFKAVASVAGTDNDFNCRPSRPVSIMHIHALNDENVPFGGGNGQGLLGSKVNFTSVAATISKWVAIDKVGSLSQKIPGSQNAYCDLYSGGMANTQVELCVTSSDGHSWPGGQKARAAAATPSTAISATYLIWNFFKSQP